MLRWMEIRQIMRNGWRRFRETGAGRRAGRTAAVIVLSLLVLLVAFRAQATSGIRLSSSSLTLVKGEERVIEVIGTEEPVSWSSSAASVAQVRTADGVTQIVAKKYGMAVITAKTAGVELTCQVTVVDPEVNRDSLYLLPGDSYVLTAQKITATPKWSSGKTSVATVSAQGVVRAKAVGTAVITMEAHGVKKEISVTVASARLGYTTLEMIQGETRQIPVTGSAKPGTWSSADSSRVSVTSGGVVSALKNGEVMLTYTVGDSQLSCDVVVTKKNASKTFSTSPVQHNAGISSLRTRALSSKSRYRFMQGSCTDGTYGYFILEDYAYNGKCAIVKIRLTDWKVIKKRTGLALGHGNDMTYNKHLDRLIVVNNSSGAANRIAFVKPSNLKIASTRTLDTEIYGIAYNPSKKRYIMGVSGGRDMVVKDENFNTIREFSLLPTSSYTRQGLDCGDKYIYVVQSYMSAGKTRVMVYDWSGYFVNTIYLNGYREAESMFHVGKRWVLACNSASYDGGQIYETSMANYYQVCYRRNGGKGTMPPRMIKAGKGLRLASNGFTRSGYRFRGWKMQRASDGKICYRKKNTKKTRWIYPGKQSSAWEVYPVPNRTKFKALSKLAGDCITLTAMWEKK